ncbi:hypothetical protein SmJEL517_g00079 [Synchytrium microbalum]|uniref:PRISE-like Rossmann-fold domain-containing protein n=1 Tax=Synchytrium microbalum TaxID=1806994 RepID=A0A507CKC8_9FUNG|nr:uncharacterized protein SmJEL517_g00079 [Synchytrium microbalum]TPX38283.1 hypothetical protein SmJEL517_g00079 [Synchytrium microbalum]
MRDVNGPNKVALILGANGITGSYLIEHLLAQPTSSWKQIIGVSRRFPNKTWLSEDLKFSPSQISDVEQGRGRLTWVQADLNEESLDSIVAKYRKGGVEEVTHVFYCAYVLIDGWQGPEERRANAKICHQGVQAADIVSKRLARVLLQTGGKASNIIAKWYGVHRVVRPNPLMESDTPDPSADFYLDQMESVKALSQGKQWDWTMTIPAGIMGFTRQSQMNLATTIMLYCALKAHTGEPLIWPANGQGFDASHDETDVVYLAAFNVWAITTPKCGGEYFNVLNADPFSYARLWPLFAAYFGAKLPTGTQTYPAEPAHVLELESYYNKSGLGKKIWTDVVAKNPGVDPTSIDSATFWFMDACIHGTNVPLIFSTAKARKFGWTGVADTTEMFLRTFERARKAGAIPKNLPGLSALKNVKTQIRSVM